jgi:hypothetical protein
MSRAPKRDLFTQQRLETLEAALLDPNVSPFQYRVLSNHTLRYANRETFGRTGQIESHPSQVRQAVDVGATEDGIRKANLQLRELGYLRFEPSRGRGANTRYEIVPRTPPALQSHTAVWDFDEKPQTAICEKPRPPSEKTPTAATPNPLREPSEEEPSELNLFSRGQIESPTAAKKQSRRKQRTALPDRFPDAGALQLMVDLYASAGLSVDARLEAEKFRNHHEAKGTLSASWLHSWRTWIVNGRQWALEREQRQQRGGSQSALDWAVGGKR